MAMVFTLKPETASGAVLTWSLASAAADNTPPPAPVPINPAVDQITSVTNSAGGTTTYVLVPTPTLPLLTPLQQIGVPSSVIAKLNAVLKPVVDVGYNRSASQVGVTTPAQLSPSRAAIRSVARSVGGSRTRSAASQSPGSRGRV